MLLINCMNCLLLVEGIIGGVGGGVVWRIIWGVSGGRVVGSRRSVRVSRRCDVGGRQKGSGPLLDEVSRSSVRQMCGEVRSAVQKRRRVGRVGGGDQRRWCVVGRWCEVVASVGQRCRALLDEMLVVRRGVSSVARIVVGRVYHAAGGLGDGSSGRSYNAWGVRQGRIRSDQRAGLRFGDRRRHKCAQYYKLEHCCNCRPNWKRLMSN